MKALFWLVIFLIWVGILLNLFCPGATDILSEKLRLWLETLPTPGGGAG